MKITPSLPKHNFPFTLTTMKAVRESLKAKFVPRERKADELVARIERPQTGPYDFAEAVVGNLIQDYGGDVYVPGSRRGTVAFSGACVTDAVYSLALSVLLDGRNDAMPILADALEEAGCTHAECLASLRAKESKGWATALVRAKPMTYIVTATKPGFTRAGETWKRWEQIVLMRLATAAEIAATAEQKAAQDAEARRIMDQMMHS